jgi:Protein of unknown function (DUF541)
LRALTEGFTEGHIAADIIIISGRLRWLRGDGRVRGAAGWGRPFSCAEIANAAIAATEATASTRSSNMFMDSLDQAREAAIADAQRKAEVYARASGLRLGRVEWISEDSGFVPPVPMLAQAPSAPTAASVPIAPGEDTLRVKVTVGFGIARWFEATVDERSER